MRDAPRWRLGQQGKASFLSRLRLVRRLLRARGLPYRLVSDCQAQVVMTKRRFPAKALSLGSLLLALMPAASLAEHATSGRAARDLRQARSNGRHGLRYLFGRVLRASVPCRLFGTGEGGRNGRGRSVRLRRAGGRRRAAAPVHRHPEERRRGPRGLHPVRAHRLRAVVLALSGQNPTPADRARRHSPRRPRARSTIRRTSPRAGSGCSTARKTPACRARRSLRWRASTG